MKETYSPYRHAAVLAGLRLRWGIKPISWAHRRRIRAWKNRYAGARAVILCNGPSLNKVDFEALADSGVFTFGLNKINLLFERTRFRPSVVVSVNPFVLDQNAEFYNQTDLPLFLDYYARSAVSNRANVHFLHTLDAPGKFARDCSLSVNQGATVTYVALQLAFHMGFQKVTLVGADHTFATKGPASKTVVSGEKDESHFDPNYFAGGVKWQLPDLVGSELHYQKADMVFREHGRIVYNSTDGGKLELFERISLEDFLQI